MTVANVPVEDPFWEYATALARHTRKNADLGVSPHGSILLLQATQARAVLDDRDCVILNDVRAEAYAVLTHRVRRDLNERIDEERSQQVVVEATADGVTVDIEGRTFPFVEVAGTELGAAGDPPRARREVAAA